REPELALRTFQELQLVMFCHIMMLFGGVWMLILSIQTIKRNEYYKKPSNRSTRKRKCAADVEVAGGGDGDSSVRFIPVCRPDRMYFSKSHTTTRLVKF